MAPDLYVSGAVSRMPGPDLHTLTTCAADQLSPVTVRAHRLRPRSRPSAAGCVAAAASSHTDEQQKVEQQQEQQGGVQVEQHTSSRRERGASIAQHEAELQVER